MARFKRKKPIQSDSHQDRWMVSYADFITLLFAFFVVMYSISSVNDAKYRSLNAVDWLRLFKNQSNRWQC